MKHETDPFQKKPGAWRILRRMTNRMAFWLSVLVRCGLLQRTGVTSRWVARHLAEIEHGLRCLLIINAPRMSHGSMSEASPARMTPDDGPLPPRLPHCQPDGLPDRLPDGLPDRLPDGLPDIGPPRATRRKAFSLTLSAFARQWGQIPPSPDPAHGRRLSPRKDALALCPADDLAGRMHAIAAVLADPQSHALRMSRRLHASGFRLRARPTVRPENAPCPVRAPVTRPSHAPAPAVNDSS